MKRRTKLNAVQRHARVILRFLSRNKGELSPLLILMHDYPDPDAIASACALQHLAARYDISSRIAYRGVIGRMENRAMVKILKLPIYKLRPGDLKRYRDVALVDTQPAFHNNPFSSNRLASLVIDQHHSVQKPHSRLSVVDTECGATSVLLAEALLQSRATVPSRLATALVYGILSDTQNLYRANNDEVIQSYLGILPFCDMVALSRIQNPPRSRETFVTLARGIKKAMSRRHLIVSNLGDIASPDLISQVADLLISYRRMHWCLVTGRHRGKLYLSLRAASSVRLDAGDVLRRLVDNPREAGGHGLIGGGSFRVGAEAPPEKWRDAEKKLVTRLLRRLRIPEKGDFHYPFR